MVDTSIIKLKLIVLGEANIGKSSLINRMALDTFDWLGNLFKKTFQILIAELYYLLRNKKGKTIIYRAY